MKRILIIGLVALAVLSFPLSSSASPKYGGTLVFGESSDLRQTNPLKMVTTAEGRYFRLISEPLVDSDDKFGPTPCLAESYTAAPDGMSWVFKLKEGVKFHNGREMVADDVKWCFDFVLDPKNATALKGRFMAVKSVEILDKYRVKFVMSRPSSGFPASFYGAGGFMPVLAKECMDADGKITHPIGTGPFKFVEWKANEQTKYVRFDDYRMKGRPYLDGVIIKPVPDATVRLAALRSGQLDMTYNLNIDEVLKIKDKVKDKVIFDMNTPDWPLFMFFNASKKPFSDPKVRQAVALAIDKSEILLGVSQGYGEVINQVFNKDSIWHCELKDVKRDVAKAKKLMKEAGYNSPVEVEVACSNTYPDTVAIAQILQMQLQPIGLKLKLIIEDWPAHVKRDMAGKFDIGVAGWSVTADPETLYPIAFAEKGPLRWLHPGYGNLEMWKLIDKGGALQSFEGRKAAYKQIGQMLIDESPWIWLMSTPNAYGWRSDVKDYKPVIGHHVWATGGIQGAWLDR